MAKRGTRRKPKVGAKAQKQLREYQKERPLTMIVEEGYTDFDGSPYVKPKRFYLVALRGRLSDLSKPSAEAALNKIAVEECPFPTDIKDDNHFRFKDSRVAVRGRTEEDNEILRNYAGQTVKDDITTAVVDHFVEHADKKDELSSGSSRRSKVVIVDGDEDE